MIAFLQKEIQRQNDIHQKKNYCLKKMQQQLQLLDQGLHYKKHQALMLLEAQIPVKYSSWFCIRSWLCVFRCMKFF